MVLSQTGLDGKSYTLTFIDACTRYIWAVNTDCRSLAFKCFVAWMNRAERQSGLKLKICQTDGGLEFFSTKFKELFKQKGIEHLVSLPYAHEQQGVAERTNIQLHNLLSSRSLENNNSPYRAWSGREVDTRLLRVFGCMKLTLPLFKEHREAKRAPERVFERHCSFATSHDEADLAADADAADVIQFDTAPNIPLTSPFQTPKFIPVHQFDLNDTTREAHNYNSAARRSPDAELLPPNTSQDTLRLGNDSDDNIVEVTSFHDYDRLHYEKTNKTSLRILELAIAVRHASPKEPSTVRQALSGPDNLSIDKYKARWVVRGFEQTHMVDFDLTYAPVGRHTSVHILICIAAIKQRPLRQIDVGSAFLYAPVDAIIFVEQPHAFEDADGALGFIQLPHDLGMYRKESRGKFILLVAYIDDLLYTGDDTELQDWFEADIKEKLEVTINHNITQFLGLNITQSATSIHLSAAKYAETLAKKFVVASINLTTPFRTPPPNHEPDTTPLSIEDHRLYQQQLGCLLFAAVTCQPDLSYVASQLAQYLKRPEGENLLDLCRALQYLVFTPDVGLTYEANLTATLQLHGYVDADHAGDIDNRRSRTEFIFQLQPAGIISWNSQKQELIALSSAESEFIATSAAVCEGLYPMELLQEAKVTMNGHFMLLCDNQSAMKIAN
ncbi:unnamed protein product [Closterium sp. NIES-53]